MNNKNEFNEIIDHIHKNSLLETMDSMDVSDKCLYSSNKQNDSIITAFMNRFDLDRICMEKRNDEFYNSVIIFHKDYAPFIGNSKTVDYDFGKSPLRNRINNGAVKDGSYRFKTIDSTFIYSKNKKPAFGE